MRNRFTEEPSSFNGGCHYVTNPVVCLWEIGTLVAYPVPVSPLVRTPTFTKTTARRASDLVLRRDRLVFNGT